MVFSAFSAIFSLHCQFSVYKRFCLFCQFLHYFCLFFMISIQFYFLFSTLFCLLRAYNRKVRELPQPFPFQSTWVNNTRHKADLSRQNRNSKMTYCMTPCSQSIGIDYWKKVSPESYEKFNTDSKFIYIFLGFSWQENRAEVLQF